MDILLTQQGEEKYTNVNIVIIYCLGNMTMIQITEIGNIVLFVERRLIMNVYLELKNKHQKEINDFPFGFAFSETQFNEMMVERFGLAPEDTDKIYSIGGGGYIRKSDSDAMHEMLERHAAEREVARTENKDDYLYHMFNYELANHEYNYTGDLTDTLDALDLTLEEINANPQIDEALQRAIKHQMEMDW